MTAWSESATPTHRQQSSSDSLCRQKATRSDGNLIEKNFTTEADWLSSTSNILVYAHDQSEPAKQARAIALITEHQRAGSPVLSLQMLLEDLYSPGKGRKPCASQSYTYSGTTFYRRDCSRCTNLNAAVVSREDLANGATIGARSFSWGSDYCATCEPLFYRPWPHGR